jgi:hypothetical protein
MYTVGQRFAPELPHDASRDVLYFEDELPPQPDNKEYVTRQIAVDRTDAQFAADKQSDVNEALRFGSLVFPASANVLEVELDRHRDAYYSLKLTISP